MTGTLNWFINRLRLMSPSEILFYRVPQQIQKIFLGRIQMRQKYQGLSPNANVEPITYNKDRLRDMFSENNFTSILPIFDIEVEWNEIDSWRKDLKNNIESRIAYYNNIKRQNFADIGDVKYVSEISRFHFLPFGALKYLATGEQYYLNLIENTLTAWNEQNPFLRSINWTSGIEVAIRSVNLVATFEILEAEISKTTRIRELIGRMLHCSYIYLKNHLSLYSSANNHLMAELMGLVVIGCAFEIDHRESKRWTDRFFREIMTQVNEDGVHMELSTRYHSEVTEQILITFNYLSRCKVEIPKHVWNSVAKMFDFIQHVRYNEQDTIYGDDDGGGVIFPHFEKDYSLYDSLLQTGDFRMNTNYSVKKEPDFRNYLLFGESFDADLETSDLRDSLFLNSGYCFLYDPSAGVKVSFDIGSIGDNISAAHGHSDILHFTFQLGECPVIVDTGTFQYHTRERFWRDYFRGISAHNCISINGNNHAKMNNRMSWLGRPKVVVEEYDFGMDQSHCSGSHNAFKDQQVEIKRTLILNRTNRSLVIEDQVSLHKNKPVLVDFYLHFHPDIKVKKEEKGRILLISRKGTLVLKGKEMAEAQLIKGDNKRPLGWYSPEYGIKFPTTTLLISKQLDKSRSFKTELQY